MLARLAYIYAREKYRIVCAWWNDQKKIDRKKETNRWLMGSCGHVCVCLYNNRITRRSKKMWTDRDKMYVGFYTFFFFILLLSEPTQHTAYTQRARGTWLNPIQRVPVSHSVWLLFFCCVCYLNDVVFWNCLCGVSLWRVNIAVVYRRSVAFVFVLSSRIDVVTRHFLVMRGYTHFFFEIYSALQLSSSKNIEIKQNNGM